MAEVSQDSGSSSKKGHKKGKTKKMSTRVDFTPMVDLGFLLITFFMLATTLIKPQTMEIAMPSKDKVPEAEQPKVKASKAITIILGKKNSIYYYEGTQIKGVDPKVIKSSYSPEGIRKYLFTRNYDVMIKVRDLKAKKDEKKLSKEDFEKKKSEAVSDKSAPIVLIKVTDDAKYSNLIDILDEMAICNIGRYAIVDITPYDLGLIKPLDTKN